MNSSGRVLKALLVVLLLILVASLVLLQQSGPETGETSKVSPGTGPPDIELPFATELVRELAEPVLRETANVASQTLRGHVLFAADRRAVVGVQVSLLAAPPPFVSQSLLSDEGFAIRTRSTLTLCDSAVSDSAGAFQLPADASAGYLTVLDPYLAPRVAERLDPAISGASPTLLVIPAGVIDGVLLDHRGTPLPDVEIELQSYIDPMVMFLKPDTIRPGVVQTDTDGRFRFVSVPAGRRLQLIASRPGGLMICVEVSATGGQDTTVQLVADAGARLLGRVTREGRPYQNASVVLLDARIRFDGARSNRVMRSQVATSSGPRGRFEFKDVPPGLYNLEARAPGFAPARADGIQLSQGLLELEQSLELVLGETISGVVLDDTGRPVEAATVGFQKSVFMMVGSMSSDPEAAADTGGQVVRTGPEGRFSSPPMLPGNYDLSALSEHHSLGSQKSVPSGEQDVVIELSRRGAIQGIVVSLATGDPVRRFSVAATIPFNMSSLMKPETMLPSQTRQIISENGTFSLDQVVPGHYSLEVLAEGHGREKIEPIEVRSGETTRGVVVMLPLESVIRGQVLDRATGDTIADARISTRSGLEELRPDPLQQPATFVTDERGRFELNGLKSGQYTLSVSAEQYAPESSAPISLLDHQEVDDVIIRLGRGGTVYGRVADGSGAAVQGAMVFVQRTGSIMPAATETDPEGRYAVRGLVPGSYTVTKLNQLALRGDSLTASMLDGMSSRSARVLDGNSVEVNFLETDTGGVTVTGHVQEGSDALAGAIMSFIPDEQDRESTGAMRIVTTDKDGYYAAEGLNPGPWSVTVQAGASFSDSARQSFDLLIPDLAEYQHDFALATTGISGRITDEANGKPIAGARVSVDAGDENATLDLFSRTAKSARIAEVFADDAGHYRVRGLEPGGYLVTAGGPAFFGLGGGNYSRSAERPVEVAEGRLKTGVDFRLSPGGTVLGQVSKQNGTGLPGVSLFFVNSDQRRESATPYSETLTDNAGKYRAEGLGPGNYSVVAKVTGFAPSIQPGVQVRAREERRLDFRMTEGSEVTIEVISGIGEPLSGAVVKLFDPSGVELTQFLTVDELVDELLGGIAPGRYDLGALSPGVYGISIDANGGTSIREFRHGNSTQTVTIELD